MNNIFKLFISIILSLGGLYFAFRQIDFQTVLNGILEVNLFYILITVLMMVFSVYFRAWRWQIILNPSEHYSVKVLYESAMIGYFGNGVLPFRMGELLRSYAVSLKGDTSNSKIFGTIILERILDLLGLILMIAVFIPFFPVSEGMSPILIGVSVGTLIVFGGIVFFGNQIESLIKWFSRFKISQTKFGKKVINFIHQLVVGVLSIRETKHSLLLAFQTIFLWGFYLVYMWICFVAVNIPVTWSAVGVVLIMTTLSISIPAAPGYVGTYHAVAVYTLVSMFNIDRSSAQTFAVVVHAVGYIPFIIIGSYYFFKNSIHFSDVKEKEV